MSTIQQRLQSLADRCPHSHRLLVHLSTRSRTMRFGHLTVEELLRLFRTVLGGEIPRKKAIEVLQGLAEAGAGRYVVGRNKHKTRIEWFFRTPTVGRAALDPATRLEPLTTTKQPVPPANLDAERPQPRFAAPTSTAMLCLELPDGERITGTANSIARLLDARKGA